MLLQLLRDSCQGAQVVSLTVEHLAVGIAV